MKDEEGAQHKRCASFGVFGELSAFFVDAVSSALYNEEVRNETLSYYKESVNDIEQGE